MKKIFSVFIAIALLFSLLSCGKEAEAYSIHTDKQAAFLSDTYIRASQYAKGKAEDSRPLPVTLTWRDALASGSVLRLSEQEDLTDCLTVSVSGCRADLYNLKIGTTYFYGLFDEEDCQVGKTAHFSTDGQAPRNLYIDGVTNARDLGGWATLDGGKVRQGMIYRTAKYSADDTGDVLITAEGIRTMTETLGIRTEIDLRRTDDGENGAITVSPLGNSVTYISFPLKSSGDIMKLNEDSLPALFEIFGEEANYPIAFHCSIGTDRTGYIAFLLNALLGVGEEDLYYDYLFSNFGEIGDARYATVMDGYIKALNKSDGDTLAEKTYRYLVGIGVDAADLDCYLQLMKQK